jgi:HAD superfamily hydrolase (TIGR01509 family)
MYHALIFDLDGLLIDSETIYRKISYKMAADFGKELHDGIWGKQMGRSPIESLTIFREELGITSHTAQELADLRKELLLEAFSKDLEILPGALEIIQAFHGRIAMAIATGSPQDLMDAALSKLGLNGYFDFMMPTDKILLSKPDPEVYQKTVEALGLQSDECIVLEDSTNGALAGHLAGCYVIAVPSVFTKNQDFSFADQVAGDLFEAEHNYFHARDS